MPQLIGSVRVPDTALCADALELARAHEHEEIVRHSLRSFAFAVLLGSARGLPFDDELVFVAAVLHDISLAKSFMTADNRFEVDGANAAVSLMHRHRRTAVEAEIVWDAIALHSSGSIARWKRPEIALINAGIVTDVHGVYLDGLDLDDVRGVLQAAPRTHFVETFLDDLAHVARTKPETTANTFVADVGRRLVPGFHLTNFVDDFREHDPFAGLIEPGS